jgi:hypothetical protein
MMIEPAELWQLALEFLSNPWVRAITTLLSIVAAVAGLWATRKAQKVLHTHEQQIFVLQRQSLNEQWQRLNTTILSNDAVARTVAEVHGATDPNDFRRYSFFLFLANLLYQAFVSRSMEVIPEDVYAAHFASVAFYFRNRGDLFSKAALANEYTPDFLQDCKRRFAQLQPLTLEQMGDEVRGFLNSLQSI